MTHTITKGAMSGNKLAAQLNSINECYINSKPEFDSCNHICNVFRNGMCNSGLDILYDTKIELLEEHVIIAKGEFWVMAIKAINKSIPTIKISQEYYNYYEEH